MNDDELNRNLRSWRVDPAVPGGFQHAVWQRIAARRHYDWRRTLGNVLAQLAAPPYAAVVVASAMILAAGAAQIEATAQNRRDWQALGTSYVRSVNPLELAAARFSQ